MRVDGWRLGDPVFTADRIATRVGELAAAISADYAGDELTVISILKGSYIFLADLTRALSIPVRVDFLGLSSYVGAESSGEFEWNARMTTSIRDRQVLLIEDIADTGRTLRHVIDHLAADEPLSIRVCAFLDKPMRRVVDIPIDYVGFEIPDHFVVGYGLDYEGWFRQLPHIATLERA
ncbi:hypoxanthine phosphoribosyltransferase [Candidatus Poribacteria bacterium]|nr:hypoxanthine phosphoribosyltransferase [Candidatus Poribacteria bacterium]MBT5536799.1 hypoxanthine phosphoribosyltransferase [Candidatus Poribacteria bacterium]MBT5714905.1 hypoxanthine phosphoribosyltransferase [Candidatus Poribacteria bacterium]MBT7098315.1 hypoxanthine phosphoribosyltransferase [Candidatus Poribacteria bacterium]MBT7804113.1 hypoxanthine phosphoribosyltransferase [Candidatus Poribacteria bacterium]